MINIIQKKLSDDESIKYVFSDQINNKFEAVYFNYTEQHTNTNDDVFHICISTQCGCAMGCKFCATAFGGFYKNLTHHEMIKQIQLILGDLENEKIKNKNNHFNLVLMGMGEPLMNYDNVIELCYAATSMFPSLKKILISTVGISPRIYKLLDHVDKINLNLYLSVHSPYEIQRTEIMPITKKFSLKSAIEASKCFSIKTNRPVKAAYLLLAGFNDSMKHADDLVQLLDREHFIVQLNGYNPTPQLPFQQPTNVVIEAFRDKLISLGMNAYIRRSYGQSINAGCGQFVQSLNNKGKNAVNA